MNYVADHLDFPRYMEISDGLIEGKSTGALRSEIAESAVISILMSYPDAYDAVAESLQPALFTDPNMRALFAVVRREIAAARHPDLVTVTEALKGRMTLPEVHAVAASHDQSARGIKGMVDLLVERHKSRELHRIAAKLSEAAFDTEKPAQERIRRGRLDLGQRGVLNNLDSRRIPGRPGILR